ncbi:MAG: hypothetical protein U1E14_17040 [Geminicoccaceae bacterium]
MRRAAGLAATLVAALLAACTAGSPPPPETPLPARQRAPVPGPDEPLSVRRDDPMCGSVAAIVDAEPAAFAGLRGPPLGPAAWDGRIVPPAMQGCTVEGDYYPRAQYVCRSAESAGGPDGPLADRFREVSGDLDRCLSGPRWTGRGWSRGRTFEFAGGERQVVWRYGGSYQRPGISLKIEEDLDRSTHYLRLAVLTLR